MDKRGGMILLNLIRFRNFKKFSRLKNSSGWQFSKLAYKVLPLG